VSITSPQLHRFCERCERVTQDGHLWCQDRDCPAEEGWPVFNYGDYLSDLKITRLISIWRTAALYEAERGGEKNRQTVWVKVAHATPECADRLRREAAFLRDRIKSIAPAQKKGLAKLINSFRPAPPRAIWLQHMPASPQNPDSVFGETTVKGVTRVFCVYAQAKGVTLREAMLENPQVWHYEAGWTSIVIAEALRPLAGAKLTHLNLSPRVVAVETDDQGHWRPTLLDLGWMLDSAHVPNGNGLATLLSRSEPAYTAPEARVDKAGGGVSPAADAYSFGMMHFEMLAGRPGVVQQWRRDELVVKDVIDSARREQTLPIDQDKFRPELSRAGVVTIIEKAISARERFASVLDIQKGLLGIYGEPPPEKRAVPIRLYILLGIIGLALIGVLVAAVVLFARGGG
jgi:hypothetical protein